MTCIVTNEISLPMNVVYICYDLEACGNIRDIRNARIWDIAAINMGSGEVFSSLVNPWPKGESDEKDYPPVKHPGAVELDTKMFVNSKDFKTVGCQFYNWLLKQQMVNHAIVFISHGNYVLDKPLLEKEFGSIGILCPPNWYFYDTLPLFRVLMKKQSSYSLKHLYETLFKTPISGHHRSLPDAQALHRLLQFFNPLNNLLYGAYYPPYFTPLQRVKYLGNHNEKLLITGGIQCVEDLHSLLMHECRLSVNTLQLLLTKRFNLTKDSSLKISNSLIHLLLCP